MRADMLVKLYDLEDSIDGVEAFQKQGITFKRALPADKQKIIQYVNDTFKTSSWVSECEVALARLPVACYVAVQNKQVIGFACYDAAAKGFVGPMGVTDEFRGT